MADFQEGGVFHGFFTLIPVVTLVRVFDPKEFLDRVVRAGLYRDIGVAIGGLANYLAALALLQYSEILGGLMSGKLGITGEFRRNFDKFFAAMKQVNSLYERFEQELRSGRGILHAAPNVYSIVRSGLVHEYLIGAKSCVELDPNDPEGLSPHGPDCGLYFEGDMIVLDVNRYFHDFKLVVDRYEASLPKSQD